MDIYDIIEYLITDMEYQLNGSGRAPVACEREDPASLQLNGSGKGPASLQYGKFTRIEYQGKLLCWLMVSRDKSTVYLQHPGPEIEYNVTEIPVAHPDSIDRIKTYITERLREVFK